MMSCSEEILTLPSSRVVSGHHARVEDLHLPPGVRRGGVSAAPLQRRPGETRLRGSDRQTGARGLRGAEAAERYSEGRGADDGGGAGAERGQQPGQTPVQALLQSQHLRAGQTLPGAPQITNVPADGRGRRDARQETQCVQQLRGNV